MRWPTRRPSWPAWQQRWETFQPRARRRRPERAGRGGAHRAAREPAAIACRRRPSGWRWSARHSSSQQAEAPIAGAHRARGGRARGRRYARRANWQRRWSRYSRLRAAQQARRRAARAAAAASASRRAPSYVARGAAEGGAARRRIHAPAPGCRLRLPAPVSRDWPRRSTCEPVGSVRSKRCSGTTSRRSASSALEQLESALPATRRRPA